MLKYPQQPAFNPTLQYYIMRILHTSDWHLGNRLLEKTRTEEFSDFTNWILQQLEEQQIDALLISGDLFDNATPGDSTLQVYHDFLSKADQMGCRYIIMTGGNHEGVSALEASAPLLKRHNAYIISSLKPDNIERCFIELHNQDGTPAALVCAVPYLRQREVSLSSTADEIQHAYTRGIAAVYAAVAAKAEEWKLAHPGLPVICMGHLTVGGAEVTASTQKIIGTIEEVSRNIFPAVFDYVALGHIHKGYTMDNNRLCYCGSPLPMGIDETEDRHVLITEFKDGALSVTKQAVPLFTLPVKCECNSLDELKALPAALQQQAQEQGSKRICLQLVYGGTDATCDEVKTTAAQLLKDVYHYKLNFKRSDMRLTSGKDYDIDTADACDVEHVFSMMYKRHYNEAADTPEHYEQMLQLLRNIKTALNI